MAEGFKIADGFVEVHADVDEADARRAAREVTDIVADESETVGRRRSRNIFAALFTPNEAVLQAMRTGIPAVLSSPIGLAAVTLGGIFAAGFASAAIAALSVSGLGAAFVALGAFALRENEKIKTAFEDTIDNINAGMAKAAEPLIPAFEGAFAIINDMFTNEIAPLLQEIFTGLGPVIEPLTKAVGDAIVIFLEAISDPETLGAIKELIIALAPKIPEIAQALADFFTILAENGPLIVDAFDTVIDIITRVIVISASVILFFANALRIMREKWDEMWEGAKTTLDKVVSGFKTAIEGIKNAFNTVVNFVKIVVNNVHRIIDGAVAVIGTAWGKLKEKIINPVRDGIASAITWIKGLPGRAASALGNIGSTLYEKGKSIIQGFINGIKSMVGAVGKAVGNAVSSALDWLPGSPVKKGPLMVLNQMSTNPGAKTARMIAEGFNMQMQAFTPSFAGIGNLTVNPAISNPPVTVRVMLDGREIAPMVHAVVSERDLQIKRAVTSGGMRLP